MSPNKAGDDLYFCRVFFVLSPLSFEEEEFVKNVLTRQLCLSLLTISVLIPPWHSPLHTLTWHFLCLRGLKTDATGRQRLPPRDRWDSLHSPVTGLWWAATSRGVQRASVHLLSLLYQGAHPNWSLCVPVGRDVTLHSIHWLRGMWYWFIWFDWQKAFQTILSFDLEILTGSHHLSCNCTLNYIPR